MKKMDSLMKQQLELSFPSAVEYIIMTLISMVDTFAISSLGSTVISAVGAMASIINFLNFFLFIYYVVKDFFFYNNYIYIAHGCTPLQLI